MPEFRTPSNAKVCINIAPFEDADALKSAIMKEFAVSGFTLDYDFSKNLKEQDFDLAGIVKIVALLDSSSDVKAALNKCLARCTYNGERIGQNTFEPAEARGDYYEIVIACLKENLSPFFAGLLSKLSPLITFMKANTTSQDESQKSE